MWKGKLELFYPGKGANAAVPNFGYPGSWTAVPKNLQLCCPGFLGVAVQEHLGYSRLGTTELMNLIHIGDREATEASF